jgi:hypothetical protein
MASEKQIAANRANAQKSTGPKTLAGKLKSSRNAYRHGLSCPLRSDPVTSAKAHAIAQWLIGEDANEEKLRLAVEFAAAQLELQRIRTTRADLMANFDLRQPDLHGLQRLVALDRYERYAHTKRRRASVNCRNEPNL